MKKIITVFLSLFLIMCLFVLPASAVGVADFFDTDIKIEILSDTFEIGRAVKFRIDFPENKPNTDTFIEIDEVAYLNPIQHSNKPTWLYVPFVLLNSKSLTKTKLHKN